MADIGKARVRVEFDEQSVSQGVEDTKGGVLSRFKGIGAAGGALLAGGVAVGAVAAGTALYGIGSTFDDVSDTIRVTTGASGKALAGMEASAKAVGKNVPADFADVGTAVAGLNQRLGITGKPLESLSTQMLNLSRLTGTDLNTNISNITRVFGDWGIKTGDQAGAMDKMYRASQATGAGIDKLSTGVVKFGGPMRQLGFSFEDTLALLGKFEKEGVNTDLVMGSMRQALGRMAKAGEEPVQTLGRVMKQIKGAGDAGKANALALELFGARAGPDMAAAIREGRFEIGDLAKQISSGGDTINKASNDTADFAEQWQLFKNRALVTLEPVAARVFGLIGNAMGDFNKVGVPVLQKAATVVSGALGPALDAIGGNLTKFFGAFRNNQGTMTAFGTGVKAALGALGAVVVSLQRTVVPIVMQIGGALLGAIRDNMPAIQSTLQSIKSIVIDTMAVIRIVWGKLGPYLLPLIRIVFGTVFKVIGGVMKAVAGLIKTILAVIRGDWSGAAKGLRQIWDGLWAAVKALLQGALRIVVNALKGYWNTFLSLTKNLRASVVSTWNNMWSSVRNAVTNGVNTVVGFFRSLPGKVTSALSSLAGKVRSTFSTAMARARDGASSAFGAVRDWFAGLPGRVLSAVGNLASKMHSIGSDIISGIVNGLRDGAGRIASAIKSYVTDKIPGPVKKALGIGSPSKLFRSFGRDTALGMAIGIKEGSKHIDPSYLIPQPAAVSAMAGAGSSSVAATSSSLLPDSLYLVVDGERFHAYVDTRADGVLSSAVRRARAGVKG